MSAGNLFDPEKMKDLEEDYGIQLLEKIDEGSFGIVFKGKDLSDGQIVAVKVQQNREKFSEIESSILSALHHPNIVEFKKFYEVHSNKYIVMEYIDQGNLTSLMEERKAQKIPFSDEEISQIMYYLLSAVKCMHENNIIHRDIKPDNILLGSKTDFSKLKLSDFGLSVKCQEGAPFSSQRCGTVAFMALEILLEKQYSKPVDIWSCGIILNMLFTMGTHPFKTGNDSKEEYVKRLTTLDYASRSLKLSQVFQTSSLAKDLFLRMMSKEPSNRYTVNQVMKHPYITRKLNDRIPLSFEETTQIFFDERKLALTIKALIILKFIRQKATKTHENSFKLTKIVRPPSYSSRSQVPEDPQIDEITSPQSTAQQQLRSTKRLFKEEIGRPQSTLQADTNSGECQSANREGMRAYSNSINNNNNNNNHMGSNSSHQKNRFSLSDAISPQTRKLTLRTPPNGNGDINNTNNKGSFIGQKTINPNNTMLNGGNRNISKFQSVSPTSNIAMNLSTLPSIQRKDNSTHISGTPSCIAQQQQQQQQLQQVFVNQIRNTMTPQYKKLSAHGSRDQRLSQQQFICQSPTPKTNSLSRQSQMQAQTVKQIQKKGNFQIKLLNSPAHLTLNNSNMNGSSNSCNQTQGNQSAVTNFVNTLTNDNFSPSFINKHNTNFSQSNDLKAPKTPSLPPKAQSPNPNQISSWGNSNNRPNSPFNLTNGSSNSNFNSLVSFPHKQITLNTQGNDKNQFNSLTNSPQKTNISEINRSLDEDRNREKQLISKSYSQSNLTDQRTQTRSKEGYKRSQFSQQALKEQEPSSQQTIVSHNSFQISQQFSSKRN